MNQDHFRVEIVKVRASLEGDIRQGAVVHLDACLALDSKRGMALSVERVAILFEYGAARFIKQKQRTSCREKNIGRKRERLVKYDYILSLKNKF